MNNLCSILWAYGGRVVNEKGEPDITNPANTAALDAVARMWQATILRKDAIHAARHFHATRQTRV